MYIIIIKKNVSCKQSIGMECLMDKACEMPINLYLGRCSKKLVTKLLSHIYDKEVKDNIEIIMK